MATANEQTPLKGFGQDDACRPTWKVTKFMVKYILIFDFGDHLSRLGIEIPDDEKIHSNMELFVHVSFRQD